MPILGLPKFGIMPLDPLEVNELIIGSDAASAITLVQKYKNIKINHLTQSNITKYRYIIIYICTLSLKYLSSCTC